MREVLANAGLFHGIERDPADAIADGLVLIEHRRGETVFSEGQFGDTAHIVLAGKVKVGRRAVDGRQNLLSVMGPSDMFGELSLFDPGPRTATAVAVTDVDLACLAHHQLRPWLTDRPEIAEQLLRVLARRLRRTNDTIAVLVFTDVASRVAKQLLALADRFGALTTQGVTVQHDLTQEELAQLVGTSCESINKTLGEFTTRGWIAVHSGVLTIVDIQHLTRRARSADMPYSRRSELR